MDKRLSLKLNGGRAVQGILRGFDPFMNVVIDETIEICRDGNRNNIGMVVSVCLPSSSYSKEVHSALITKFVTFHLLPGGQRQQYNHGGSPG